MTVGVFFSFLKTVYFFFYVAPFPENHRSESFSSYVMAMKSCNPIVGLVSQPVTVDLF